MHRQGVPAAWCAVRAIIEIGYSREPVIRDVDIMKRENTRRRFTRRRRCGSDPTARARLPYRYVSRYRKFLYPTVT